MCRLPPRLIAVRIVSARPYELNIRSGSTNDAQRARPTCAVNLSELTAPRFKDCRVSDDTHIQEHTHNHNRHEPVLGPAFAQYTDSKRDLRDSDKDDQTNWSSQ